ncbi:testicular acid phosphatase homolog isoform X2 [Thrips palmi]|uniref:Testicular acid phosphatase homolog isoform X2 n=1 Tax=Thrips palmi TaxID=161013 RepID=A0A6P9A8N9_THRPL|nr:testicular acid phosphatase homolog isoform X2 [Thrips palmi]
METENQISKLLMWHGDRNPTESYATDPYNDIKYWPGGWGALTNKGKLQMYKLGKYLRSRYAELLGETYSSERLLVRSSYADRVIMSAGALLAGLQPPSTSEIWLPGFNWHPIPIHSTPRSLDQLITVKKKCPRYDKELKEAYQSEEISKINTDIADLYRHLSANTGQNVSTVLDVEFLFNTLEIEEANGHKLPDWTKEIYPEKMKEIATISVKIFSQTPSMKRFVGGPLINDMIEKMVENHKHSLDQKHEVFLIAGHDMTVLNVMRALGFDETSKPDIGAAILIELHAGPPGLGESTDFVKLFYMNSSSTTDPIQLSLNGCDEICSLDSFVSALSHVAIKPSEWETECNN